MDRSDRGTEAAAAQGRRESELAFGRGRFRPVALPALAAAVQASRQAGHNAQDKARRAAPIVHEDEPVL